MQARLAGKVITRVGLWRKVSAVGSPTPLRPKRRGALQNFRPCHAGMTET